MINLKTFILKSIPLLMLSFITQLVWAQMPQYSQFYANALYLSPAFAGSEHATRGILAYRNQWPGLEANYITTTASVDHHFTSFHSGVALMVSYDNITPSNLKTTEVSAVYSYEAELTKKIILRMGIQPSFVNRRIDAQSLTFGSQYSNNGYVGGDNNEDLSNSSFSYVDFAAGALLTSNNFWAGLSIHNLTRPNQSFYEIGYEEDKRLPAKISLFGGYKFMLSPEWKRRYVDKENEEKSISPTFLYKSQGKSDQLDLGVYGRINSLALGLLYRGITFKRYDTDESNRDALIFIVGLVLKNIRVGYSYDATLSKLTMDTGGSHEITLVYTIPNKNKNDLSHRRPQCPKF